MPVARAAGTASARAGGDEFGGEGLQQGVSAMRIVIGAIAAAAALAASDASAQLVNLTGRYRCVELCTPGLAGQFAYITQNGNEMNIVNDAGEPSRAWLDYPGRIWVQRANQGAVYSPDGLIVQFDRGTVWQRVPDLPPPLLRRRR
jgi:hypothetical protein